MLLRIMVKIVAINIGLEYELIGLDRGCKSEPPYIHLICFVLLAAIYPSYLLCSACRVCSLGHELRQVEAN